MDYVAARQSMVENQIRTNKVSNSGIIDAFERIPREWFVPEPLAEFAYMDQQLRISSDRYILEPMVLAQLLQFAGIGLKDLVLEIGCGTGYSTSIIAHLAQTVVAVEEDKDLAKQASGNLIKLGVDNAAIMTTSLVEGYREQSPYDVIIICGAVDVVPKSLTDQLADGGRLVSVINKGDSLGKGVLASKFGSSISFKDVFDAWTPNLPGFVKERKFVF